MPYYFDLGSDEDFTLKPTIFDDKKYIFQNEYRKENKFSSFIADFSFLRDTNHQNLIKRKYKPSFPYLQKKFKFTKLFAKQYGFTN